MKKLFKLIGIIALLAIIGFSFATCSDGDNGGGGGGTSGTGNGGNTDTNNWGSWRDPSSTATINYSVDNNGVCSVTVGGTREKHEDGVYNAWKLGVEYPYTGKQGTYYEYKFEAWTQSDVRNLHITYYSDDPGNVYLYDDSITINKTRQTYSLKGAALPKSGKQNIKFQLADQLGTVYIKMLEIGAPLSGNITISPSGSVAVNTQLTATYSGSEPVTYQWKKDGNNVGTNSNQFTPTEAGSYTVTVSATGYNSKTSNPVTVIILNLSGNITISPNGLVAVNTQLTATYSGSEPVTYQWKKDGNNVGTNSNQFTPTEAGSYTVTVSATGYNSKTCAAVTVFSFSWKAVTNSTFGTSGIYAIAYGNGIFVAGGDSGKMAWSTDGATWTAVTDSTFGTSGIGAIAYGNGKFVAGGKSDKMAWSTDGITWTAVTNSLSTLGINAITYGNGKFVAGGRSGRMAWSTDGVTWTAVGTSTFGTSDINAIAYGNNGSTVSKFVAGGYSGKMAWSTDGVTWTAVGTSTFGTSDIVAIAYGNGKFVAGCYDGKKAWSTDGVTWTAAVSNSTSNINAIAYGNGKFVAGGGAMAYLTDGTTWTAEANLSIGINAITYGNGKFVAVCYSGRMAYFLDD